MSEKEQFERKLREAFELASRAQGVLIRRRSKSLQPLLGTMTIGSRANQAMVDLLARRIRSGDRIAIEVFWWFRHRRLLTYIWSLRNAAAHAQVPATLESDAANNPPRRAQMLLFLVLPREERHDIIGDLEEEYRMVILPKFGRRFAHNWYWSQALRSTLPLSWTRLLRLAKTIAFLRALRWIARLR